MQTPDELFRDGAIPEQRIETLGDSYDWQAAALMLNRQLLEITKGMRGSQNQKIAQIARLSSEISIAHNSVNIANNRIYTLACANKELQNQIKELQQEVQNGKDDFAMAKKDVDQVCQLRDEINEQKLALIVELRRVTRQKKKADQTIGNLQQRIVELESLLAVHNDQAGSVGRRARRGDL